MKYTTNFNLKKPEGIDSVNIQELNDNFDSLDEELLKKSDLSGNASDMSAEFTQDTTRGNIKSGDKLSTIFGKQMKWYADMKESAYCSIANNLTTEEDGFALDARQGKRLKEIVDALGRELTSVTSFPDYALREVLFSNGSIVLEENMFISCNLNIAGNSQTGVSNNGYTMVYFANNNTGLINITFPAVLCKKGDVLKITNSGSSTATVWKIPIKM